MRAEEVVFFTLVLLVLFCLSSHMEAQESKRTFILVEVGGLLAGNAEGQPWEASQIQHNGKYFVMAIIKADCDLRDSITS